MPELASFAVVRRLGGVVGSLAYLRNGTLRHVTRTNIDLCFPNLSEGDRSTLVRQSLRQTGRFAAEFGLVWRPDDQRWKSLIRDVVGTQAIDDAQRSGSGVLVLVPHFGNWEVLNLFLGERYATYCAV